MSRSKTLRTSKNALMLLAGTMTRMVASFAFVIYSANLLSVEGFGKLAIATHFFELFLSLTATAIGILLTRDVARWPRHLSSLLTSAIIMAFVLCCLAPLVMIPLGIGFRYSDDTMRAIGVSCIGLFPAAICVLLEAVFVSRERAEFVTFGTAVESLLRIALSVLVLRLGYGIVELMWVMVFSRTGLLFAYSFSLRQIASPSIQFSARTTRRFLFRWRVFAAENWMATIYTNLDVLVLSWVAGEVAVGLYSAAWKFVRLGSVFAKSFTTAVFPVMSRMYIDSKDSFHRLFQHTVRVMCAIALPAVIGVSVLTDRIVAILYKEEFAEAGPILRVLIWVLLLEFLNPFLSHVLFAQGKQHRSMVVAAISLSVNSIATYLLVRQFGAIGAAAGCILGGLVATICYLAFSAKMSELPGIVASMARVLIAASGMGLAVYLVRESSWPIVIVVAAAVYVALLFLVQAVRMSDVRFFKSIFLTRAPA